MPVKTKVKTKKRGKVKESTRTFENLIKRSTLANNKIAITEVMAIDDSNLLTPQEVNFCKQYCLDFNGREAAIRAGYPINEADKFAGRLLKRVPVLSLVDSLRDNVEKIIDVSKAKIAKHAMEIVFSSLADMYSDWMELKNFKKLTPAQKACIQTIETHQVTNRKGHHVFVKIKLFDKLKAMEILNQMMGYNEPVRIDQQNALNVHVQEDSTKKLVEDVRHLLGLKDGEQLR